MDQFPIGCRVILKDLTKAEYNGKVGVVQSKTNQNGRQQVSLQEEGEEKKILGLKPINLKLEPRSIDSLSTREMKTILSRKDYSGSLAGFDKSDLKALVEAHVTDPDEIANILAKAQAATTASSTTATNNSNNRKISRDQLRQQAANISPEQLRQQAQMMRSMDPSMIRRMNPAMANFSDAQIQMAATQMETMANNPHMMSGMVNQINNMDDDQLNNLNNYAATGTAPINASAGTPTNTTPNVPSTTPTPPNNLQTGMQNMANMSPDQLRQQATMMKSMSKDTLRSMNPLMANWPDSQIDMAISQMEMMANNPDMTKKMMDQMKNMKPEDIENIQKMAQSGGGATTGPSSNAGFDPSAMAQDPMAMLKNTNPAQIKQMLQMVKDNPALFKDMIRASNPGMADQLTDEQISKTMESFANLDEKKIGWMMTAFGIVQNVRNAVKGKGLFLLMSVSLFFVALFWFVWRNGQEEVKTNIVVEDIDTTSSIPIPEMEEDEF